SDFRPDPNSSDSDLEPDTTGTSFGIGTPSMGLRAVKILHILTFMDGQNITLVNLLDAISWGDADCTLNAKIRNDRTALLKSPELPGIL
ncbi:hypothetical protein C8R44DRAFT_585134, partial [Mycena epipterygia]